MLNELLIAERGARRAGLRMDELHPDMKSIRRVPTLVVRLAEDGRVASIYPLLQNAAAWTLRDGQHNSFPFVQPKAPLWTVSESSAKSVDEGKPTAREALLGLARAAKIDVDKFEGWPGAGLLGRLREREGALAAVRGTPAAGALAAMERFALAAGDGQRLLSEIAKRLVIDLRQAAQEEWVEVAAALLIGVHDAKQGRRVGGGAILFDAADTALPIYHPEVAAGVSTALRASNAAGPEGGAVGVCGVTGETGHLIQGTFPQPKLPVLGQTYLFARNPDIPSTGRYGRFAADAMPVGEATAVRLAAAISALTAEERRGLTWRPIPGERPQQTDLLLAFVEGSPEVPAADTLSDDEGERDGAVRSETEDQAESIAAFETRARRIIEAVQAKAGADFRKTPVRFAVLRAVDKANRKVVYEGQSAVGDLYDAVATWARGERSVPPWFALPVSVKGGRMARASPPHVAPLGLIAFSRAVFRRGGTERSEAVGIPATEAMRLFLAPDRRLAARVLRLVLARRSVLGSSTAHAARRGLKHLAAFETREALRTASVLGVLLGKLGKEDVMSSAAFKLGQLLAASDVVHAGYCADVRGGDTPPSLLGNQVFAMAQRSPNVALAALGRRWKPYIGWAKRAGRDRRQANLLADSKKPDEQRRGWDIRKGLRHARDLEPVAAALGPELKGCTVDDAFRAQLLLGYMAGLPRASGESVKDDTNPSQEE